MIEKRLYYGGGTAVSTADTDYTVNPQVGRIYSMTMTNGSTRRVRMPDARILPYTGYAVFAIVNLGASSIDIVDNSNGTTIVSGLAQNEMARMALFDNSTQDGTWYARVKSVNTSAADPADLLVLMGGEKIGIDNANQRFDTELDSWTSGTVTPDNASRPLCLHSQGTGYFHELDDLFSYDIDSYSTLTESTNAQSTTSSLGGSEEQNKLVCYKNGFVSSASTAEEWDDTDTWTSINSPGEADNEDRLVQCSATEIGDSNPNQGWLYIGQFATAGESHFQEHSNSGDSYTNHNEGSFSETSVRKNWQTTIFPMEGLRLQTVGNRVGSTNFEETAAYTIATDSWAADTDLPETTSESASQTYSQADTKALIAGGEMDTNGSDTAYEWNDTTSSFTQKTDLNDAVSGVSAGLCRVEPV